MGILIVACFLLWVVCYANNEINTNTEIETAKIELKKVQKILATAGLSLKIDDVKNLEKQAQSNLLATIAKLYVTPNDLVETDSNLGLCTYAKNSLITNIQFRSASTESYMQEIDPYLYLSHWDYQESDKNLAIFAKQAPLNYQFSIYSQEELKKIVQNLKEYQKHLMILLECASKPIKITANIIKKSNIEYFKLDGVAQYVSDVSGGGVSLGGAVLGGVIAGGAGAVVGSQIGTEINTDIVKKDDRRLSLHYFINEKLVNREIKTNNIDFIISLLRTWIPDKEYEYVMADRAKQPHRKESEQISSSEHKKTDNHQQKDFYSDLIKLKELLDLGIISQEEFEKKKREILQ